MNLTKQEMEDIWNFKPVGYLKFHNKKTKGMKKYKVTFKPYTYVYHEEITAVVIAKDVREAERMASYETKLYDTLHEKYGEVKYGSRVEEVK